jgi:hypothetical protein
VLPRQPDEAPERRELQDEPQEPQHGPAERRELRELRDVWLQVLQDGLPRACPLEQREQYVNS